MELKPLYNVNELFQEMDRQWGVLNTISINWPHRLVSRLPELEIHRRMLDRVIERLKKESEAA